MAKFSLLNYRFDDPGNEDVSGEWSHLVNYYNGFDGNYSPNDPIEQKRGAICALLNHRYVNMRSITEVPAHWHFEDNLILKTVKLIQDSDDDPVTHFEIPVGRFTTISKSYWHTDQWNSLTLDTWRLKQYPGFLQIDKVVEALDTIISAYERNQESPFPPGYRFIHLQEFFTQRTRWTNRIIRPNHSPRMNIDELNNETRRLREIYMEKFRAKYGENAI